MLHLSELNVLCPNKTEGILYFLHEFTPPFCKCVLSENSGWNAAETIRCIAGPSAVLLIPSQESLRAAQCRIVTVERNILLESLR